MCDKCKPHARYWIHLADKWSQEERVEMYNYLLDNYMEGKGT